MPKKIALCVAILLVAWVSGCNIFNGESYSEKNENGFRTVALTGGMDGVMNRLSFGTSSRQVYNTTLENGTNPPIRPYGCVIQDSADVRDMDGTRFPIPSYGDNRHIVITAINESNNAGKIAGSEDGIAYYFKKVNANMNFRLTADFYINNYGFTRGKQDLNGQEAFGIMARDYVPQYYVEGGNPDGSDYDYTMDRMRMEPWNGQYYTGRNRPDGPGGSGNMIMVGAVKRGARVYWRTGVTDSANSDAVTNPNSIANADFAKFYFLPREFSDYSMYGSGQSGIENRPDFPTAGLTYTFTLEKTNSGFKAVIIPPSGVGKGVRKDRTPSDGYKLEYSDRELPFPDLLFEVTKDEYYVGFFACRDAKVTISNIRYEESPAEMCPPRVDPEPEYIKPDFTILSPPAVSQEAYTLNARSNVEGTLSVSVNGATPKVYSGVWVTEPTNASAIPFTRFEIPVERLSMGNNFFSLVFTPDPKQEKSGYLLGTEYLMTSTASINASFYVNRRTLDGEFVYVAPNGRSTNAGTVDSPMDIATAISCIAPGQTIILEDGIYTPLGVPFMRDGKLTTPIEVTIPRYNNGEPGKYKTIIARNRDKAIFDFGKEDLAMRDGYTDRGFELHGDYWWIEGIHVRNTSDSIKGLTVYGSNNVIRWVKAYYNGDTGIQISGRSNEPKSMWPAYNTVEYCESFANMDDSRENADGFASKLTSGPGNVFKYCIAHHNADDGWDLFAKKETGAIGALVLEKCIAYSNGKFLNAGLAVRYGGSEGLSNAEDSTRSGGNGFKMGGEGISVTHLAIDCLSFFNDTDGFTSNSDPAILLTRCTAFNNTFTTEENRLNQNYAIYGAGSASSDGLDAVITQVFSFYSPDFLASNRPGPDRVEPKAPASGYVWRNGKAVSTIEKVNGVYTDGRSITAANIVSMTPPYYAGGVAPFDSSIQGSFIEYEVNASGEFVRYKLNNFLRLQGIVGEVPGASGLWD